MKHKIILKSSLWPFNKVVSPVCDRSFKQFLTKKILEKSQVGNSESGRSELVLQVLTERHVLPEIVYSSQEPLLTAFFSLEDRIQL